MSRTESKALRGASRGGRSRSELFKERKLEREKGPERIAHLNVAFLIGCVWEADQSPRHPQIRSLSTLMRTTIIISTKKNLSLLFETVVVNLRIKLQSTGDQTNQ